MVLNRENTCCFTGHRVNRLPWKNREEDPRCLNLKDHLDQTVEKAYELGFRHFICGMAQGCDFYFGESVVRLKDSHPGEITLEAAIPFLGQADYWTKEDRDRRNQLLDRCDFETVVQHVYSQNCMFRRNRYMVDHSALIIAVYDGYPRGGTMNTLLYAMQKKIETLILQIY